MEEYKQDKEYLENRVKEIEKKQQEEQELEQYNFTFEDVMLKCDLESIKCLINPLYQSSFQVKWEQLSIKEKQELIMSYIETIEVIKKDDKVKEATTSEIKEYYDNEDFEQDDIYDIAKNTTKEDELFEYANIDNYYSKSKDDELEL